MEQIISFRITTEMIQQLLKGKELNYNNKVRIHPPQDGLFITRDELDNIIRDKTNMADRLLKLMENNK